MDLRNKFTRSLTILLLIAAAGAVVGIILYNQNKKVPSNNQTVTNKDTIKRLCSFMTPNAVLSIGINKEQGNFYADGHCRTLYTYTNDKPNESNCNAECAKTWMPYLKNNEVVDDLSQMVTTIKRQDGKIQYAINGKPLYYFIDDKRPGDTNGQGKNNNSWSVIITDQQPIIPF